MKLLGLLLAIGFMLGGGALLLLSFGVEGFPMLRNAMAGIGCCVLAVLCLLVPNYMEGIE